MELAQLTRSQVPPGSLRNAFQTQGAQPNPPQTLNRNAGHVHHPTHDVVEPLVDHDAKNEPFPRLPQDTELLRHNPAPVDGDAFSHTCKRAVVGPGERKDVVLLVQTVARVHDPVGNIPVVREEQKPLSVPIQSPHRIDPLRHVNQVHDGPPAALVTGGGDVAGRFVEDDRAWTLSAEEAPIDANLGVDRVHFGSQLGNGLAVHGDPPSADHLLGRTAGAGAPGGHYTLQPLHGVSPPPSNTRLRENGKSLVCASGVSAL